MSAPSKVKPLIRSWLKRNEDLITNYPNEFPQARLTPDSTDVIFNDWKESAKVLRSSIKRDQKARQLAEAKEVGRSMF